MPAVLFLFLTILFQANVSWGKASIADRSAEVTAAEKGKVWLIIKNGGQLLEIANGYNVKMDGGGKVKFSRGGRVIELLEPVTALVNEKAVSDETNVYEGDTVRVINDKGVTVWRLAPLPADWPSPFSRPPFAGVIESAVSPVSLTLRPDFRVVVDPRVELLSVVQVLSGYGLVNEDDTPYRRNVEAYFAPYKNHPAVKLYTEMSARGFAWEIPSEAMTYLTDVPTLSPQYPFSNKIKQRAGGEQRLNEFLSALRDFARETKFASFYGANRGTYLSIINDTHKRVSGVDYVGVLESYYGVKQSGYTLILAPLSKEVGFASSIERGGSAQDVYGVIGRSSVRGGIYIFGEGGDLSLQQFLWHEFSHPLINPLTAKNREIVAKYASLFDALPEQVKSSYRTWEQVVNEHIIRAVTSRIASRALGKETGERELKEHKDAGFIYVEALYERLKEYESQRDKYSTFDQFYPRLIDAFGEITQKTVR